MPLWRGFPGGASSKEPAQEPAYQYGRDKRHLWIPGLGRSPGEGYGNALHYSCLENPHGQRSLAGYSPWRGRVRYNWNNWACMPLWKAEGQREREGGRYKWKEGREEERKERKQNKINNIKTGENAVFQIEESLLFLCVGRSYTLWNPQPLPLFWQFPNLHYQPVKDYEELVVLTCLQDHKLGYYIHGCWQKTLGSETKDLNAHSTAKWVSFMFMPGLFSPCKSMGHCFKV